jgi:CelD/BcsL family acetyltransferase involved in cellulose biosynthesis
MGLAIRGAIEEGATEFDLLHGAEAYKFHWARHTRRLGRMTAYPPGLRGTWLLRAADTRAEARRLWRKRRGSDAASPR